MNLLKETIEAVEESDHALSDIVFIGSRDGRWECNQESFGRMADREYDEDLGIVEVYGDLVVTFRDGSWLERAGYDGAESWVYKRTPMRGVWPGVLKAIFGDVISISSEDGET